MFPSRALWECHKEQNNTSSSGSEQHKEQNITAASEAEDLRSPQTAQQHFTAQHAEAAAPAFQTAQQYLASKQLEANARGSPLLRLPPEIRLQIYGYVLGGNTIHVGLPGDWTVKTSRITNVCRASVSDQRAFDGLSQSSGGRATKLIKRHMNCRGMKSMTDALTLLLACRQTYTEASPVFLQENMFAFSDCYGLKVFSRKLAPSKRKLVKHVRFYSEGGNRWWAKPLGSDIMGSLTGIREITFTMELDPYDVRQGPRSALRTIRGQDSHFSGLYAFALLELQKVDVMIWPAVDKDKQYRKYALSEMDIEGWRQRVLKRLMDKT